MALIGEKPVSRFSLPNLYRRIQRSGGDVLSIGRPGYRAHSPREATIGKKLAPGLDVPNLYRCVPGARDDTRTIGRPGYSTHGLIMVTVDKDRIFAGSVEDVNRLRDASGGRLRTSRRPFNG